MSGRSTGSFEPGKWLRQAAAWLEQRLRTRETDVAAVSSSPRRDVIIGLAAVGLFLLVLLGWGSLARLDAGVYAPGAVEVAGERQAVQSKDGGIVSEIDVHDGDKVKAGQILLKLAPEGLEASERAAADQVIELQALQARLQAEINDAGAVAWPGAFAGLAGQDRLSAQNAMRIEQREFDARRSELTTQKAVLAQRQKQLVEQIEGNKRQVEANLQQQKLIQDEIDGLSNLLRKDLVPITRLRSLQRAAAELKGSQGEYDADIAKGEQQIGETRYQINDLDRQRISDASKDYREAQMQLSEAEPKLQAIREQIARTTVRSPADGRVNALVPHTLNGVVGPGQKLMDIVPDAGPLVIQANIRPNDASDIRPGLTTEIRIPAFRDRRMPLLNGVISKVSADTVFDEKTGAPFFRAEVVVPASELKVIRQVRGDQAGLRPGLPVEVVVPLRNRTALEYLTEPLRRMLWKSFRDQ